jgi:hypothetical protein
MQNIIHAVDAKVQGAMAALEEDAEAMTTLLIGTTLHHRPQLMALERRTQTMTRKIVEQIKNNTLPSHEVDPLAVKAANSFVEALPLESYSLRCRRKAFDAWTAGGRIVLRPDWEVISRMTSVVMPAKAVLEHQSPWDAFAIDLSGSQEPLFDLLWVTCSSNSVVFVWTGAKIITISDVGPPTHTTQSAPIHFSQLRDGMTIAEYIDALTNSSVKLSEMTDNNTSLLEMSLKEALAIMLFLLSDDPNESDIEEHKVEYKDRAEKRRAERESKQSPKVFDVGWRTGTWVRQQSEPHSPKGGGTRNLVGHTVRGHFRVILAGKGRSQLKRVWVRPHKRGGDKAVGRIVKLNQRKSQ